MSPFGRKGVLKREYISVVTSLVAGIAIGLCIPILIGPTQKVFSTTFAQLAENPEFYDGKSVELDALMWVDTRGLMFYPTSKVSYNFDELMPPWVISSDERWMFQFQHDLPEFYRRVKVRGFYQSPGRSRPALGSFSLVEKIEMLEVVRGPIPRVTEERSEESEVDPFGR